MVTKHSLILTSCWETDMVCTPKIKLAPSATHWRTIFAESDIQHRHRQWLRTARHVKYNYWHLQLSTKANETITRNDWQPLCTCATSIKS